MKIFISYSTKIDKVSNFAKELKTNLKRERGVVEVFICEDPENIPASTVWANVIATKVKDCDAFIPIITQEYLDSIPCHQEIHDAHYIYKKDIFPILFEDRKPEYEIGQNGMAIQSIVKRVQYTTFKTTIVEHPTYDDLLAAIKQKVLGVRVPSTGHELAQKPKDETSRGSTSEDKPERGSVTLSGHNQVNVSGATAGGNITIHMGGGQDINKK